MEQIDFNYDVERMNTTIDTILGKYKDWFNSLTTLDIHNKDDFMKYINSMDKYDVIMECIDFLQYVHGDANIRKTSRENTKKVSTFFNEWSMNTDIYEMYKRHNERFKDELDYEETLLMERLLKSYTFKGIHKSAPIREKLTEISDKLTKLSIKFSSNLNELESFSWFTKEELDGVDSDFISNLETNDEGKYKITVKYDHINEITTFCNVESTRKIMNSLFINRCRNKPYENHLLLQEALKLRHTQATLLDYNNYVDYKLSYRRMAENNVQISTFLQEIYHKMEGKAQEEIQMLCDYFGKSEMESWNYKYYANKYKKEKLSLDQKEIQNYFPLDKVMPKLLNTFETIFNLNINVCDVHNDKKWHKDVLTYIVTDKDTDVIIGYFYMDLYPRKGKYGHAAAFTIKQAYFTDNNMRSTPVSAMVCNFTRPTSNKPSLLTFREVETFFHELGHIFHQLLSQNRFSLFSGTAVERDFVECPSQALECWCYEPTFLQKISCHYQTNEPMPLEIMKRIKQNKNIFIGLHIVRQILFGMYDIHLHMFHSFSDDDCDVLQIYNDLEQELSPLTHQEGSMAANFGHLMGGYQAGYYGYLWSEVYAAEVFQLFKSSGDLFNVDIGKKYRKIILERGGTQKATKMLVELLGRKPTNEAFLQSITNTSI